MCFTSPSSFRAMTTESPPVCHLCGRLGPGLEEATPPRDQYELEALTSRWKFEGGLWTCPLCLRRKKQTPARLESDNHPA